MARAAARRVVITGEMQREMEELTEQEIFAEALGETELENDGDRSLEEMDDPFEPEDEPEEIDEDQEEVEVRDGELDPALARTGRNVDPETDEEVDEETTEEINQFEEPRSSRIPSWAAPKPQPGDPTLTLLTDISSRLTRLEQPQPARTQPEQRPEQREQQPTSEDIDPIIDPQGFREAIRREMRIEAQQSEQRTKLALSFDTMHSAYEAEGRGQEYEFAAQALNRLVNTAKANPGDAEIVRSIITARDPGRALMEWAEEALDLDGHREAVEMNAINQLANLYGVDPEAVRSQFRGGEPRQAQRSRSEPARQARRQEQAPLPGDRGEQRPRQLPQQQRTARRQPPSLNSAGGAGRDGASRGLDMRGMDGSENAIFEYALS